MTSLRPSRLLLALLGCIVTSLPLHAQYFGRNKVRYDDFDFRAIASEHFDVYYYPAESLAAHDAARQAERWYARHSGLLAFDFRHGPLIFYADHPDFQQTNVIQGFIGEGTGGVTEGGRERVVMPFTGVYAETDHVLGHEIVHVFQYRMAKATPGGMRNLVGIPLWLIEGMAEYLSLGRDDPNTAMWLRDAARRNDLPTLDDLSTDPRYFPYRYGQAVWAFIGGRWGDATVNRLFRSALERGWQKSVPAVLGMSGDSLSKEWHAAIRAQFAPELVGRDAPDSTGRTVVRVARNGDQNVAPTVSPDGKYVAFFSSRDIFGIDLYVAEVATGRVARRLTRITSDAHFDALSFINSSGSFSPDGRRLAVVTFSDGDNDITVFDVGNGKVVRRIRPRGVPAMSDPAWSPDGRRMAFAGMRGGISDLYVHDLESGETRQLTRGREAELQPAWSPDGRQLVFITDRGPDTDFELLSSGKMRLATIDVDQPDAEVRLLETFNTGKSVNPQFSPDGASVYFVSDHDGVSNIYRRESSGNVVRVTNVATGVSGISSLSPSMSMARSGVMVFSVFDKAGFAINALDDPAALGVMVAGGADPVAGLLPPAEPVPGGDVITQMLADDRTGLPAASAIDPSKVDRGLGLDYIGGASVGVTTGGGYGSGIGGGVGFGFSDMLGDHNVGVVIQAQGDFKDIGGSTYYLNQKRRWNWGLAAAHVPYASVFATAENVTIDDGQGGSIPATVFVQQLERVYFQNADLLTQYPFSRTRRFELSAGLQRVSFGYEVDSQLVVGNQVVDRVRRDISGGPAINMGRASAALVGDNSFSAFTSPVAGGRYRMEVAANTGDLQFQNALLDFRRYFFMRPLTFAVRGMHFGRYGGDAESNLLGPLFIGQPQLIRGYDAQTFGLGECTDTATDFCPEFTRLTGSRMAVMNVELRIPLFGNERFGLFNVPFLPIELSPFFDAGVAWTKDDSPELRFDREAVERVPVFSAGVSTRLNLFGSAVVEIYWVQPFQRPEKGSYFGFQLAPGW